MNNIKTIADFKRAMQPGTFWECTHQYIGEHPSAPKSLGTRECVLHNSADFGFKSDSGATSHSAWPKKLEFSTEDGGNIVVITKENFCQLKYRQSN